MIDERANKKALETAARAVHENYYGSGTWRGAGTGGRSAARHAVRLTVSALEKHGLAVVAGRPPAAPPRPR